MRLGVVAAAVCLSLVALSVAADAEAAIRKQTNIPAQALAPALKTLAKERNFQIVYVSEEIRDRRTEGAQGEFTPGEALTQLLSGTGLTFKYLDEMTVTLVPVSAAPEDVHADGTPHAFNFGNSANASTSDQDSGPIEQKIDKEKEAQAAQGRASSEGLEESAARTVAHLETVVITGTHIRGVRPDSSPVVIYDRKAIERSGAATVEQFVKTIPQNFGVVDASTIEGNSNTGDAGKNRGRGAGVNLRGLGTGATLVLVNGHRLAPAGSSGNFVDISMIPLGALDRVEVLTDGASAIYGSDAVAGVVNFVLRRDFSGAETAVRIGDSTRGGAEEIGASQTLGADWSRGNIVLSYDFFDQEPLAAAQRSFIPDLGAPRFILPDQRRHSGFLTARVELSERVNLFADVLYSDRKFTQDTTNGIFQTHIEGGGTQSGATLGATFALSERWYLETVGNYSRNEEGTTNNFFPVRAPTSAGTETELLSWDLRTEGAVFSTGGGVARVSLGIGARREEFIDSFFSGNVAAPGLAPVGLEQDVVSAYGEVFLPFVSEANERPLLRRLELSLAARYDDYRDAGSSTDPKVGLLWSPLPSLKVRGTYSTSFRAPLLAQLTTNNHAFNVLRLADPAAPDGFTNTILSLPAGDPDLVPEESTAFTAGFSWDPAQAPGLSISASYYDIDYTGRIATPPVVGGLTRVHFQRDTLGPFIDLSPDPAVVAQAFSSPNLFNPAGLTPASVEAIYHGGLHNIATASSTGVDLTAKHNLVPGGRSTFDLFLSGTYQLNLNTRAADGAAQIDLVDKIFQPMDLRIRGGASWSIGGFTSSLTVNYSDDYENNLVTPTGRVGSWTTVDVQLAYRLAEQSGGVLQGTALSLSGLNVADKDPPFIQNPNRNFFGFDPTNASPRGRFVSILLSKRW